MDRVRGRWQRVGGKAEKVERGEDTPGRRRRDAEFATYEFNDESREDLMMVVASDGLWDD